MAIVTLRDENKTLTEASEISKFLEQYGIWYRYFDGVTDLKEDASNEEILAAFAEPIDELKKSGGYVTADVINVTPETPGLDAMLNKFNKEHWHDEDEVRFIVDGSGVFHVHPENGPVFSVEMFRGDMINVPTGTYHWFDLCKDKTIKAIRLFQDTTGWSPHYTESETEQKYQPLCFGPGYVKAPDQKKGAVNPIAALNAAGND